MTNTLDTLEEITDLVRSLGVPKTVSVEWWPKAVRTFGQAQFRDGEWFRIRFSSRGWKHLTPTERRNLIIHESAHVLCPPGQHHGPQWKALCLSLGGDGRRLVKTSDKAAEGIYRWLGMCPNGHRTYRHVLYTRSRNRSCAECDDKWNPDFRFEWTELR